MAIGDLNGDGSLDLATANSDASTVSVLLGNGNGSFGGKTDFGTGSFPRSVAIGDPDGDGNPDLATANSDASTVSVLLGNGNGTFGAKTDFGTGSNPRSVALGDVSGDGKPDLAVANENSSTVSVLLGLMKTRTKVSPTRNVAVLGSQVTLTATVSVVGVGHGVPTGSVRFFDGTTLLGAAPVSGGVATLVPPATHLGDRSIAAVYLGDARLFGSISATQQQLVIAGASVDVADGATLSFALEAMRPNPMTSGRMNVSFALPIAAPARLQLVDVKGRMVATRDLGSLGAGRHVVDLAGERKLAAGVYLVRLTQGSLQRTTRVVVLN